MFEIILVVIAIIAFINLSGRINRLEERVKRGVSPESKKEAAGGREEEKSRVFNALTDANSLETLSRKMPEGGAAPGSGQKITPAFSAARAVSNEEEGGRWLAKVGIVALLLGVSFFLKYAFDNNLIGVVGRVILGLISGVAMLAIGQYLRAKYENYSNMLMGGGIGILYLTIYASFAFYNLIGQPTAFIFMFLVTALTVVISIVDGAFALAVMGIFGGFLTPYLISTGQNAEVSLFTYILILDIGVLVISFREKWQKLNYLAFIGTAMLFMGWAVQFYKEEYLFITFAFLSAFFLIFLVATVAHHLIRREVSNGSDLGLVTINALAYFGMSYAMLDPSWHAFMGFFAVVMALLYFLLAFLSLSAGGENKYLNLYLSGIAILFLTLAIPIQLSGTWITLAWLIEAVIIAGFSTAIPKAKFHAYGPIVYIVGVVHLFSTEVYSAYGSGDITPFLNKSFFLFVVAVLAAYVLGFFYDQAKEEDILVFKPKTLAAVFLVVANLLTIYSLTMEVSRVYDRKIEEVNLIKNEQQKVQANYLGDDYYSRPTGSYNMGEVESLRNQKNTAISILWALYAIILTIIGFAARSKTFRSFGLVFFFVTAVKIFIDVWSLGQLYRIISSIAFGVLALLGSFAYAKYKDRIKQIITE
ncbi:MAG: DUF2339 domain-containing protein [bacterium]|nr:DUF2339 domain-containing protein [bacterium]